MLFKTASQILFEIFMSAEIKLAIPFLILSWNHQHLKTFLPVHMSVSPGIFGKGLAGSWVGFCPWAWDWDSAWDWHWHWTCCDHKFHWLSRQRFVWQVRSLVLSVASFCLAFVWLLLPASHTLFPWPPGTLWNPPRNPFNSTSAATHLPAFVCLLPAAAATAASLVSWVSLARMSHKPHLGVRGPESPDPTLGKCEAETKQKPPKTTAGKTWPEDKTSVCCPGHKRILILYTEEWRRLRVWILNLLNLFNLCGACFSHF